jgi:S1-C subfamily serine protease
VSVARIVLGLAAAVLGPAAAIAGPDAPAIPEVFRRVKPSVVVLETTGRALGRTGDRQMATVGGLGSGVLVDTSGVILTAAHVVQAAEEIRVHFADGTVKTAHVRASEPAADVAAIQLDEPPAPGTPAPLGDSDRVEVGDAIFIVGAPLGISYTLTFGHVSARRRGSQIWGAFSTAELLQTDAVINQGNSGGPMFNTDGEVIGIVSSMISRSGGFEGLGFVVTSNLARELVLDRRARWTGLEGYVLQGTLAQIFNLPQPLGLLVQRVAAGSPAARLGLRPGTMRLQIQGEEILIGGDVVLGVQGVMLTDPQSVPKVRSLVNAIGPGGDITVTVLRDGRRVDLTGKLD